MPYPLRAALLGLTAGFGSGLLGIGGGVIIVPGLVLFLHFDQARAHGTSVAVIVPAALTGALVFAGGGEVNWAAAAYLLIGASVGAFVGARLTGVVSKVWLARAFVVVLLVAAARMGLGS